MSAAGVTQGSKDHDALRLWLRLLTCTTLIEGRVRAGLRERFRANPEVRAA